MNYCVKEARPKRLYDLIFGVFLKEPNYEKKNKKQKTPQNSGVREQVSGYYRFRMSEGADLTRAQENFLG